MSKSVTAKLVTPRGELAWVMITGEGKPSMNGKLQYLASVILDPLKVPEHKACLAEIDAFWEANKPEGRKKAKSLGYAFCDPLLDKEGNKQYKEDEEGNDKLIYDPKGRVSVTFKTGTTFKDGKRKVIKIYNAKNQVVGLGDQQIGNGSEGHLSGSMGIYINYTPGTKTITSAGVSLYLDAIQLKKFVAYAGADAGFEADESDEDAFMGFDDGDFEGVTETKATPRL